MLLKSVHSMLASLCLAVALALSAGGCGDASAPTTHDRPAAQPSVLAPEALAQHADEICGELDTHLVPLARARLELAQILVRELAYERDGIEQLRALRPPPELRRSYQALVATLDARRDSVAELLATVRTHAPDRGPLMDRMNERSHRAQRLSVELGLQACPWV